MESGIVAIAAPMTVTFALLALGLLSIAILLRVARGQHVRIQEISQLEACTQPVDLPAFRNLVDPEEEKFLREHLSPAEFRRLQRERMLAAAEYVRRTAHNAAVLLNLGEAVRRQTDAEIADSACQLVNSALRLRRNAFLALGTLYLRILFPGSYVSLAGVITTYETLTDRAVRLTRLQNPAYAARVSAAM
jgi:hypothetical protein